MVVSWFSSLHPVPMGFEVVFIRDQRQPLVRLTLSPHLLRRRELSTAKGNRPGSTVTPNHVPTAHSHSATPAPWVPPPLKLPAQGLGPASSSPWTTSCTWYMAGSASLFITQSPTQRLRKLYPEPNPPPHEPLSLCPLHSIYPSRQ